MDRLDEAADNFKQGKVSAPIDLDKYIDTWTIEKALALRVEELEIANEDLRLEVMAAGEHD